MRAKVADYIDKAIEESKKEVNNEETPANVPSSSANNIAVRIFRSRML
jgi:hypothetical protein